MSGRTDIKSDHFAPGPGAYDHDTHMGKAPAYSLSGRPKTAGADNSPGPAAYSFDGHIGKAPAYSLSGRTEQKMETLARKLFKSLAI